MIARLGAVFAPVGQGDGAVAASPVVPVRQIFARFWPYARPYRGWFVLTLVLIALGALVGWALGSAGIGIAIGAVVGIPAAIVAVYRTYRSAF